MSQKNNFVIKEKQIHDIGRITIFFFSFNLHKRKLYTIYIRVLLYH